MKIKYITNVRIPTPKAAGFAIVKMCSEMAGAGADIELFVPERKNSDSKKDPFDFYGIEKNFRIIKVPSFDLLGKTLKFGKIFYWLDLLSFFVMLKFKVHFNKGDILYTRDPIIALFFPGQKSTVLELHSIPKSKFIFNLSLKRVKFFVVLNSYIKSRLMDLGISDEKILISPSGTDLIQFNGSPENFEIKGISKNDFVYGYIGSLKTMGMEKGVADGLRALALLPTNCKFLVVGGGETTDFEYYKNMSVSLRVSDRVIFTGEVSHSEVYGYSAKCDVLIAPFPENEHYSFFMSPLKIFEYMACKKPIITTNLPSLREVLTNGENAILVPPGDPQALVDAILKLKEHPEYGKKLVDKAYQDVSKNYTWKTRAEKIISFIK
jgi:glycosyltransferase involved in cell wall biosynthesis